MANCKDSKLPTTYMEYFGSILWSHGLVVIRDAYVRKSISRMSSLVVYPRDGWQSPRQCLT